ncbi:pyridoxamine 5'-phosphate oxidase family protein [Streptomyces boncukensis]|uniref:Pyridoxamine 5'-phosphate oxidase n=1 Tax=Streptomyces boncukensis TaxID=2711219 RepID=A0A6G4WZH2_9ACTN|nr:pyridoxamine 5'-phosphate oxidase family protein [Streptomyces boncukensis]NGO70403.1 pyridoxamine 5'-phosphate oxidase [Streptomyces boncukensis]
MGDLSTDPGPALRKRLAAERNVWLCTVRPDGSAHVTPVWFVYRDSRWWIGVDGDSVKAGNVRADPRVSLALEDGRSPVVAEGEVSLLPDGFPPGVLRVFAEKYGWDPTARTRPGVPRVLLSVRVRRWLLRGTAR